MDIDFVPPARKKNKKLELVIGIDVQINSRLYHLRSDNGSIVRCQARA